MLMIALKINPQDTLAQFQVLRADWVFFRRRLAVLIIVLKINPQDTLTQLQVLRADSGFFYLGQS